MYFNVNFNMYLKEKGAFVGELTQRCMKVLVQFQIKGFNLLSFGASVFCFTVLLITHN